MRNQSGNVFFAIFGAVALVGVLTAGVATFVKGPLATSVKITRMNTAENQMSIAGQVAVMAAANAPGGGDCDSDTFVEPIEWREDLTKPFPVGGGLIPLTIGINKKDPWGTEYGYCVWDHGAATNGAGTCGGATQKRLAGHNSKIYPVVALVSAGPDKTFTTTCRSFADADVNGDDNLETAGVDLPMVGKAASNDDDIIFTYTYDEATGASGGLWSLKSGDPGTAIIDKKIESTGVGSFAGGVLLPDSSLITCDPTTAGIMAKNASGNGISICDGTDWQEISGGVSTPYGVGLIINPSDNTAMDVTAPCGNATCYSVNTVFTVVNKLVPPVASAVLGVTLSNTSNFEKVSDSCIGNSIAAGGNCQIVVRAKGTGNKQYTATLSITGNNSPFATLSGTASGFGCTVGGDAPGGKIVSCNVAGSYNLITTPSGCTAGTTPTCAGGADSQVISVCTGPDRFGYSTTGSNGLQNSINLLAYSGGSVTFPTVEYCNNLIYGGYDDWYLPSSTEMTTYFWPARTFLGGSFGTSNYATSSYNGVGSGSFAVQFLDTAGGVNERECYRQWTTRCARRDPTVLPGVTSDTTPEAVSFTTSSSAVAAEIRTSNTIGVYGVTIPVNLSITGGTNAEYSKNGGAYTNVATTVKSGDMITLRATSPVAGQEDNIALAVGSSGFTWKVRTIANNTVYAFVTSTTYSNFGGGIAGADAQCNSRAAAAGLGGTWMALLATGTAANEGPASRAPWNWTTLKNLNNQVIATSYADFTDGTLSSPINRTEFNAVAGATWAWTGAGSTTGVSGVNGGDLYYQTCNTWSNGGAATYGAVHSTTMHFWGAGGNYTTCANSFAFYCMQDPGASLVDTDPEEVVLRPGIAYAPGAAAISNAVSVRSILQPITITITPAAGTADIIKNGVSQGATTTIANPNDSIQFSQTVPVVLGTKNTSTIVFGDDNYNWWVGYADGARETQAFTAYKSGGNHGGLSGADTICNTAASNSTYGLSGSWKAILSDSGTSAANRVPWNWGILKTVTGAVIVDGGYNDLFDGNLDGPIGFDQNGGAINGSVWTGSNMYGISYTPNGGLAPSSFCYNWTNNSNYGGGMTTGFSSSTSGTWLNNSSSWCGDDGSYGKYIYCIENTDDSSDVTPNDINLPYKVQVPASSRQTSDSFQISGLSSGVTQTMSVTATGGTPTFKINGGGEVTSGTIKNGDSIVLLMDAPAGGNSNNRMTITAGSMTSYWRVWTGDLTGTAVKRMFVATYANPTWGGLTGFDAHCQSKATSAALGGTWKAILSGDTEANWAVNRIGYNWSTLRRVDGTDLVSAGNIWSTKTLPLLATPTLDESGTVTSSNGIMTNTTTFGKAKGTTAVNGGSCTSFTTNSSSYYTPAGSTGTNTSQWIENNGTAQCYTCCGSTKQFYCIEQ